MENKKDNWTESDSYCSKCDKTTKSFRESKLKFVCAVCGNDKTLGDIFQAQTELR